MKSNRITTLFGIEYPIIQGGMVWISGWRLASAVSNAGGLGLLGAGSMHPETLIEHIHKMKEATDRPWGVNVPLMYPEIDRLVDILIEENIEVPIQAANMPPGKVLRTFPSRVRIRYVVGAGDFRSIQADQFLVEADYDEIAGSSSDKCKIYLRRMPASVKSANLDISQVDYLVEQ